MQVKNITNVKARLLSSLLVCAASAFTQLQAASVSDLTFSLIDNSTAYAVTGIDANATGSLVVPSTHNGLPVTEIGHSAFRDSGITSIELPGSLTSLGDYAFYNCTSLSGTVTIPAGVTVIPPHCFYNTAITGVVFEGDVTSIGRSAFYGTGITSIELPDSLTSIGNSAFRNCGSLTGTVTIPAGVTVIPDYCFRSTAITGVVFEGEVTEIGRYAFYGTGFTSIELPGSLTSLEEAAFFYCTSLSGTVTIPAGVTVIPDWCFSSTAITEVVFEGEVTSDRVLCFSQYLCSRTAGLQGIGAYGGQLCLLSDGSGCRRWHSNRGLRKPPSQLQRQSLD
jgi:hypothetical protein